MLGEIFISRYPLHTCPHNMSSPRVKRARAHDSDDDEEDLIAIPVPLPVRDNFDEDAFWEEHFPAPASSSPVAHKPVRASKIVSTHPDVLPHLLNFIEDDAVLWRMRLVCASWSRAVARLFARLVNPYTREPRRVLLQNNSGEEVPLDFTVYGDTVSIESIAGWFSAHNVRALSLRRLASIVRPMSPVILSPILSFSRLKSLELHAYTIDSAIFCFLSELETLKLSSSTVLWQSRAGSKTLKRVLRHLHLHRCTGELQFMRKLTRLETLTISGDDPQHRQVDDDVLEHFAALRTLRVLAQSDRFTGVELHSLKNLHELRVYASNAFDYDHLRSCTALRKLHIDANLSWGNSQYQSNVTLLGNLTSLTELTFATQYNLVDIDWIGALTQLRRLSLSKLWPHTMTCLEQLSELRELHFYTLAIVYGADLQVGGLFGGVTRLPPHLTALTIFQSSWSVGDAATFLANCPSLRRLCTSLSEDDAYHELMKQFHWIAFTQTPEREYELLR
jgi:hypothetical protein